MKLFLVECAQQLNRPQTSPADKHQIGEHKTVILGYPGFLDHCNDRGDMPAQASLSKPI